MFWTPNAPPIGQFYHYIKFLLSLPIDYDKFRQMFFDQTKGSCATDGDLACYVVDNNGFVIISGNPVHTGKFFGEVDGTILDSLIQHQIYKTINIYDYQV